MEAGYVTLEAILTELKRINAVLESLSVGGESGGEERLPSISVEDMAYGKPVKITTKSYDGRPLPQGLIDEHIAAHAYARAQAAMLLMNGFADTVKSLEDARR